jgi:proteasome lid subunit RPN8/RPN11
MNFIVDSGVLDRMMEHARATLPNEACGLLVGRNGQASRFIPTENTLRSETEYEIDPAFLAATFRLLRDSGEELVGIFHSHPKGPARPSNRDLERAYYPEAVHVIVSLADPESPQIGCFRIIDGQAYEVELHAIV